QCGGSQICEHNKVRSVCNFCGGGSICKHERIRSRCRQCGGLSTLANEMLKGARRRAKRGNLPFRIAIEDVLELIGDGFCPILGTRYNLYSSKITDDSATLDKFIPELGYVKGNCAVISSLANRI